MPTPPRRTQPGRTAAAKPNPAAEERRALREALAVQATRLEEQDKMLRQVVGALQGERKARLADRTALRTVINRQASIIEGLNVRHETTERQMSVVANASGSVDEIVRIGRDGYQRVAAIYRKANPANPAQPIQEPNPEPPVVTTVEEAFPGALSDVTQVGASPLTDVSPDAVTAVDEPYGMTAVTPEGLTRTDVTAPVAGTNVPNPPEQVITPVDVRYNQVGADDPTPAFGWTMGPTGAPQQHIQGPNVGAPMGTDPTAGNAGRLPAMASQRTAAQAPTPEDGRKRAYATMRLAKLQIEAGLADGDEITVAASLDSSGMPDRSIAEQIDTLSRVASVRTDAAPSPDETRHLVPRLARGASKVRSVPSMAGAVNSEAQHRVAVKSSPGSIHPDELGLV